MNIPEVVSYDKDGHIERFPLFRKFFLSFVIILVALLSFGIGRLSVVRNKEPIKIEYDPELTTDNSQPTINTNQAASVITATQIQSNTTVIGSKNSNKYHYSYCPGAKQIKEENKIVFSTPETAQAAGYTLAANCSPR